jgi:hypothetical protein
MYKKWKYTSLALDALQVITILNALVQFWRCNLTIHKSHTPHIQPHIYIHPFALLSQSGYLQTQFIIVTVVTIVKFTESHWSPVGSQ